MAQEPVTVQPTHSWWCLTWPRRVSSSENDVEVEAQTATSAVEDQDRHARRRAHPFYNYGREIGIGPGGWAYLARYQNWVENGPILRRFGTLHQRLLAYYAVKLVELEKRLLELDNDEEASDGIELRGLSPWQRGLRGDDGEVLLSERDEILHEINKLLEIYGRTLQRDADLRKMDLLDRDLVHVLVRNTRDEEVLDKSALGQFVDIDDFVTTKNQNESIHNVLERYIYRPKGRVLSFLMKKLFKYDKPEGSTFEVHYRNDRIKSVFRAIVVLAAVVPLMLPMNILYFAEPNKVVSVLVVILPCLLATWMLASVPGRKFDQTFIAVAAYLAVLCTFLANLQGPGSGQCVN